MAKRIKLGLIFGINKGWIAGSYYIINLVEALKLLPKKQQPFIYFLCSKKYSSELEEIKYPYWDIKEPIIKKRSLVEATINKLGKVFKGRDIIDKKLNNKDIDILYPASFDTFYDNIKNRAFWIPDFQHHYYPEFFTDEEINDRNTYFSKIIYSPQNHLILSSNSSLHDLNKYYPKPKAKIHILPFAVTHPEYSHLDILTVKANYNISKKYFIVTNQFWQHKNHLLVLESLKELIKKTSRVDFQIVFTGKNDDYRAPKFYDELMDFVTQNNLKDLTCFVGFIDRSEQLLLMKNSIAIIQPSKFEGWSTVVEDAKAINQFILLSDIEVHHEQTKENVEFFNPNDPVALSKLLLKYSASNPKIKNINYNQNRLGMANNLLSILSEISR